MDDMHIPPGGRRSDRKAVLDAKPTLFAEGSCPDETPALPSPAPEHEGDCLANRLRRCRPVLSGYAEYAEATAPE